jgi:hypothetical protein
MKANDTQVGGDHYKSKAIQPWDYIVSNNLPFLEGCIIKYVSRWQDKGGVGDLRKAQHFLAKLIEVQVDPQSPRQPEQLELFVDYSEPLLNARATLRSLEDALLAGNIKEARELCSALVVGAIGVDRMLIDK